MGTFSAWHWLIVLAIVLILFGAKRIPELAKGLGSGIKNFKNALKEDEAPVNAASGEATKVEATATATTPPAQPANTTTNASATSAQDAHKA